MVCARTYLSAKSLGSERAQAAMFSYVDSRHLYSDTLPHRVTRSTLDFGSLSSSARVYYCSLSYARDLFQVLPTPFVVISTTNAATRRSHIWCDVKLQLRHTSRDERAQALCANFVLQATNAQGLGTRQGYTSSGGHCEVAAFCVCIYLAVIVWTVWSQATREMVTSDFSLYSMCISCQL